MWLCWELWIHRLSEMEGTHQLSQSCWEYGLFSWKQMRSSRAKNGEVLCFMFYLSLGGWPPKLILWVNNKLSHMLSLIFQMKSAYWSVPVLLSSLLSESAVASTPLRNSLSEVSGLWTTNKHWPWCEMSLPWDCGPSQSTCLIGQSMPTLLCWQWMKWNVHWISHLVHRACLRSQLIRRPAIQGYSFCLGG